MHWINRPLLEDALAHVLRSPRSSFYRDKYARAGLAPDTLTAENFLELPLLSRQEMAVVPIEQRTFAAPEDLRAIAFTSGTSASEPLSIPVARVARYSFDPSFGCNVSRTLLLLPPMMKSSGVIFTMRVAEEALHPILPVFGDLQSMANSAFIAKSSRCDSLWALPTIASAFAPYAQASGFAGDIKLIILAGETTTVARRAELQAAYPNALIGSVYGSNELSQIVLFTCPAIMRGSKNRFHVVADDVAAVELIDGEFVITYGLNRASPLIRYRTGDYLEEVAEGCTCGLPGPVLEWSYRGGVDRLRINGMQFDVEEVDRAFATFPHIAGKEYQVHFYPVKNSTAIAIKIETADPALVADAARAEDLAAFIERELPDVWRLSATATMRTALQKGAVASCTAEVVSEVSERGVKLKRFVNHVE